MAEQDAPGSRDGKGGPLATLSRGWAVLLEKGPSEIQFWFIALAVGIAAALAAIAFRGGIILLQGLVYGTDDIEHIHSFAAGLDWYWILVIPILGGLFVGILLDRFTDNARVRSVADVIEAAALRDGRVQRRRGLVSALASLVTLSTGGSTGREGPVVHLAAVISSYASAWMRFDGVHSRDLLGCAVAAAVSASFNAPIAGAIFALEVVLRHFAVHAFAPIAIASVAGTVLSRLVYGDVAQFGLPQQSQLEFYIELPAFLILGLVCGLVAVVLMRSIFLAETLADRAQARTGLPRWARPALAGAILGAIAIWYPQIIGVGYETTSLALTGSLLLHEAIVLVMVKVVAVAVTMGGRMGGGVFSPSLMIGALTGLAFGIVATGLFPNVSGEGMLYALAGMGAVSAAVLGAPISTTLIVFELTGDWQTGLAVMVSVSLSSALASRLVDRSFFLTQLERRGVHLAAGPQTWLLGTFQVASVMRATGAPRAADPDAAQEMVLAGTWLAHDATLEQAMPLFEKTNAQFIPVVKFPGDDQPPEIWGALFQVDALRALNRAMARTAAEEHS
ncbi:chloride channel protein [Ponticoccus sp. SC2-23]|uniref:chloride channel protein n=1 Tax=Alexandriicola marinus TaxID=2081710 RepID=UPI000FD778BE|nr:chloride channel protein [Alexandriicola marinus]MBM1219472.1 chloride channel protein [Ponticoccus sp. SC6-9]MBM1223456.1 chloride channel protein [Ponticoccus sp. SC6-15]MBM1229285.1 chloride channel protein [Ponticoccus sp. SC6-38]MBM1232422.1 chloride channel protein [Ponticoccus sp. SC6-45]MBM1237628.1 chloride channel protein [Ponticoccus sp. SC6-49]MBM1241433.1 chloride channel protein [Ponticoccus sp. SC2-64]MBM1245946.1 chloride channel protein [Ponticoccus sp. SC6-42]MBM1250424